MIILPIDELVPWYLFGWMTWSNKPAQCKATFLSSEKNTKPARSTWYWSIPSTVSSKGRPLGVLAPTRTRLSSPGSASHDYLLIPWDSTRKQLITNILTLAKDVECLLLLTREVWMVIEKRTSIAYFSIHCLSLVFSFSCLFSSSSLWGFHGFQIPAKYSSSLDWELWPG